MKKGIMTAVLISIFSVAVLAGTEETYFQGGKGADTTRKEVMKELNLSQDQKDKIKVLTEETKTKIKDLRFTQVFFSFLLFTGSIFCMQQMMRLLTEWSPQILCIYFFNHRIFVTFTDRKIFIMQVHIIGSSFISCFPLSW